MVDRLVVVVLSGRPVMLDAILPGADAVVAAWLPGTEGAGVGDVLFGDRPFTGRRRTPGRGRRRMPRGPARRVRWRRFPPGYGLDATGKLLGPKGCVVGL